MNIDFGLFAVELATLERNFAEFYEEVKGSGNSTVINAIWRIQGSIEYLRSINKSNFAKNHEPIMLSLESMRLSVEIIITEVGKPGNTNFFLRVVNGLIIGMGGSEKSQVGTLSVELKDELIAIQTQYSAIQLGNHVQESDAKFFSLSKFEQILTKQNLSLVELNDLGESLRYFSNISRGLKGAVVGIEIIETHAKAGLVILTKIIKLMPKE